MHALSNESQPTAAEMATILAGQEPKFEERQDLEKRLSSQTGMRGIKLTALSKVEHDYHTEMRILLQWRGAQEVILLQSSSYHGWTAFTLPRKDTLLRDRPSNIEKCGGRRQACRQLRERLDQQARPGKQRLIIELDGLGTAAAAEQLHQIARSIGLKADNHAGSTLSAHLSSINLELGRQMILEKHQEREKQ